MHTLLLNCPHWK